MLLLICVVNGQLTNTTSKNTPTPHVPQASQPQLLENHSPEVALLAQQFLMHLLRKDWERMFDVAAFPFWLESKAYSSFEDLHEAWEKQLSQKHLEDYEIRGIEVLTVAQMKERFGPPPARLNKLLSNRDTYWFAVANVSGRAVVLLIQPPTERSSFKVVAFHD